MAIPRSASLMPPLRRSRSASMSSLAQVDLSTLDSEVVLDYARKVMQLQPQPATSSEKLQMLFALSQKLLRWFLEERERLEKQLVPEHGNSSPSKKPHRTEAVVTPLHIEEMVPQQADAASPLREADRPSLASRVLACTVAVAPVTDVKLGMDLGVSAQRKEPVHCSLIHPAEPATTPMIHRNQIPEQRILQTVTENEPLAIPTEVAGLQNATSAQEEVPLPPRQPDALEIYLQVQRSVICMQKYVRGFMARRRFFRALEELLQGCT